MRILLITDNHTPTGGAENYFFELKARLKTVPGFEVYSLGFAPQASSGDDFYVLKNVRSNIGKLIWQIILHPFVYLTLRKQLKKIRPDVIHIHNVKQYSASVLRAIKPYPVVQTVHDYTVICPTGLNLHKDHQVCETGLRKKCFWQHQTKYNPLIYLAMSMSFFILRKRLQQTVNVFFAPSPLLADYLQKNKFNHVEYVAPFKTDTAATNSFSTIKPSHFLFAGHLGLHKGVRILIEEFALACVVNSQLQLTIAGTGPEEKHMQTRVQTLGIESQVKFIGWQKNLESLYDDHTAIIFPSIGLEAFGLVMIEGMSRSRPIIGANRGTSAWIIDNNETGLLFDPAIKGDLAKKLLQLADNIELSKTLGARGREKLQGFINNEAVLTQITAAYKKVKIWKQDEEFLP